jgi:hypothetical protein
MKKLAIVLASALLFSCNEVKEQNPTTTDSSVVKMDSTQLVDTTKVDSTKK